MPKHEFTVNLSACAAIELDCADSDAEDLDLTQEQRHLAASQVYLYVEDWYHSEDCWCQTVEE